MSPTSFRAAPLRQLCHGWPQAVLRRVGVRFYWRPRGCVARGLPRPRCPRIRSGRAMRDGAATGPDRPMTAPSVMQVPDSLQARKVVAAIADDAAARGVLSVGGGLASPYSGTVEAGDAGGGVAGRPVEALTHVAAAESVVAMVTGGGGATAGKGPADSAAMALLASLEKPIAVVPPNAPVARAIESMLVPLDGTAASATALQEIVALASDAELDIVVAHVHQEPSLPAFSDHLPHEVRAWSDEFIARYCPSASEVTLELRVGEPHEHLLDILRSR